jgi:SAM-dependent methyltransferase
MPCFFGWLENYKQRKKLFLKKISICKICGSNSISHKYQLRDFRLDKESLYSYSWCAQCGVIFQNPQISQKEMLNHYNQESVYDLPIPRKGIKRILFTHGLHKRAKIIKRFKNSGRLLDIGCGSGAFINFMAKKMNFEVMGTEINETDINYIKKHYSLNVFFGDIGEVGLPEKNYDVITLWDVLEHIHDPKQMIINLKPLLKPDGLLVLRVPNLNSLDSKIFKKFWAGLDAPRHYYIFSEESILKLLRDCDFQIKSINQNIGGYLNFITSVKFWLTDSGISKKNQKIIVRFLRSIPLQIIFFPIFWIKNRLFEGTGMTIVAKRTVTDLS